MLVTLSCNDRGPPGTIAIGLVSNMPPNAGRSTVRQFRSILAAAAEDMIVGFQLFGNDGDEIAALPSTPLDGLIVTGTPPVAKRLRDEPSWPFLSWLVGYAWDQNIPTIWSCLACHAAVLQLHGIERRRLPLKVSGLMPCIRTSEDHALMDGMPRYWCMPHSRYNDLSERELVAEGCTILSRSAQGGVDIFVDRCKASFLFLQGHPEYEAQTLLREYYRDIGEFIAGAREHYPQLPSGYLGTAATKAVEDFRIHAIRGRSSVLVESFPLADCQAGLSAPWRTVAVRLFANWLSLVAAGHTRPRHVRFSGEAEGQLTRAG